ncbi:MAG: TatD family hydrolase, partial [Candidatus Thorarchaeota archaeon]
SYSEALDKIRENKDRIVAVGEIGLDHYRVRDHSERELQTYAFRELALFAIANKLPVQIHSRSAGKAALEVLYGLDIGLVQMHAFDGKSSYARTASHEYGYYFSIPTSVVRSPQKKKLVKAVDIERLLVETDSPVLGPIKGVRNEPSNILIAVKEIAKILAMEEEEIRNILLENTLRLYPNLTSNKLPRNQHK